MCSGSPWGPTRAQTGEQIGPRERWPSAAKAGENAPSHELVMRVLFMDHFGLCAHREPAHSDDRAARIRRTISSRCVFQMRLLGTVLKCGFHKKIYLKIYTFKIITRDFDLI